MYFGFAARIELGQDTAVFTENVVDVAHEIGSVTVLPVVEGTSAMI